MNEKRKTMRYQSSVGIKNESRTSEKEVTKRHESLVRKRDVVKTSFIVFINYLLFIGSIYLTFVINDAENAHTFILTNYLRLSYMLVGIFLLFVVMVLYFYFEARERMKSPKDIFMVFVIFHSCYWLSFVVTHNVDIYARLIALFPLLCTFLLSRREAMFLNIIYILCLLLVDMFGNAVTKYTHAEYSSLLIGFCCGMLAIFLSDRSTSRIKVVFIGFIVAIPSVLMTAMLELSSLLDVSSDLVADGYIHTLLFAFLGCIFSLVIFLAALPIFEILFNKTTKFRLREMTSSKNKLMMRLMNEAPGTFNHSSVVAQLAQVCAHELGEDEELARACAYYHDVGKLRQPDYFTENQQGYNKHDELTPELSADIIRSHARDGYNLIKKEGLPMEFADVAREHHGTLPIKYFYAKAAKLADGDVDIETYSYEGPKPRTKIAAIIMIADACESATRALGDHRPQTVEKVVRGIIEERMALDQFADCDITIRELTIIKTTIVNALTGVYHSRIKYPDIKIKAKNEV